MPTSIVNVPAGSTSAVIPVTALTSVLAGPAVLGGTVTLSFASNPSGPFNAWSFGASTGPQSFRSSVNGYIQVAAATQAANVALCDLSGAIGSSSRVPLCSVNAAMASASSTSEQVIGSLRIPAGFLPMNGLLRFSAMVSMLNGADAKTIQGRIAGISGTLFYQSGALASNANVNLQAYVALAGDGFTQKGYGSGLTNIGLGLGGATAYTAYTTTNYQLTETEYVITCTKATAGDLMVLQSMVVELL